MKKNIRRGWIIAGMVLILLVGSAVWFFPRWVENQAKRSFPKTRGETNIPGLDGTVEIYRDSMGVPHIYAGSHHDLYLAQGYVHAQDRFWQMDFWRHQGAGRLSELLGKSMLENDKFLRTIGWERIAKQEFARMGAEERAILEAYTQGVNAYLQDRGGTDLSLEYAFLPLINPGYEPASWTPVNTLTWGKAMAWDLKGNLDEEIDRAILLKELSLEEVNFLYPPYPAEHPVIIPAFTLPGEPAADHINGDATPAAQSAQMIQEVLSISQLSGLKQRAAAVMPVIGGGNEGIGSNSWVVAGSLTETGKPFLANDPHLSAQMPSIWYEVGLHCYPKSPSCPMDVAGFSFAGVPGVVIGHNDRIAWGLTNVGPDVMDLYIEKIHPENPTLYQLDGEWKEMEVVIEELQVPGKDPISFPVYLTENGPLIGEVYGQEDFDQEAGIDVPDPYGLSLRWTALEPSCVFCAVWQMNLAQNWDEFRKAAEEFAVPSQNLVYADVEGNIGYQMPGHIPIRGHGHNGMLPAPGWTGSTRWQGYIPFTDLPFILNPPEGYIITANNQVVDPSYPHLITHEWSSGFRAQRIEDLILAAPRPITLESLQEIQGDNYDLLADELVPRILALDFREEDLRSAQSLLAAWDRQADLDSAPAALYMVFWQSLQEAVFADDLPEAYQVGVESRAKEVIRILLRDPDSPWWDDQTTPEFETRDQILANTFQDAVRQLKRKQGKPENWQWGALHTITFQHQVMTNFPILKKVFDRGPFAVSGGTTIINATGWDPEQPYLVDSVPSMRMLIDFDDLSRSLAIHTTGQSGHAYHDHYQDMVESWRLIDYHPMLWDRETIINQSEGCLTLKPGN